MNNQKPTQCFKCKGWGHPRRLCPSQLNYSRGDDQGTSLPSSGLDGKAPSVKSKHPALISKITQILWKYHNPDPLVRLIGLANKTFVIVEGESYLALIDCGAQLSALSESLVKKLNLKIHKLDMLIEAEAPGGVKYQTLDM